MCYRGTRHTGEVEIDVVSFIYGTVYKVQIVVLFVGMKFVVVVHSAFGVRCLRFFCALWALQSVIRYHYSSWDLIREI